jgi:AbiTii
VPSIIEEIQRDAVETAVPVSALLRRMKLAATKLGLGEVEAWVEQELNGYPTKLPDYRIVQGAPMALNPIRGWQPVSGAIEVMSRAGVSQSVASLEALASRDGGHLQIPFSDEIAAQLNKQNGVRGWPVSLHIDRSEVIRILDRVRTLVLDWALKMEQAGVTGTSFGFNETEKAKAQAASTTIYIGSIGSFAGNLGAGNVAGDVAVWGLDLKLVSEVAAQLKAHIDELAAAGADGPTLKARLDQLEAEVSKATPATSVLRGLLVDVRNAVAGAAGNLMATGATALINQILGTGVPAP